MDSSLSNEAEDASAGCLCLPDVFRQQKRGRGERTAGCVTVAAGHPVASSVSEDLALP